MISAPLTMAETAAAIGQHYDTFRKAWPKLRKQYRFPAPFSGRPYKWLAEDVEAWRVARTKALGEHDLMPLGAAQAANDDPHPDPEPAHPAHRRAAALAHQRAQYRRLQNGAK